MKRSSDKRLIGLTGLGFLALLIGVFWLSPRPPVRPAAARASFPEGKGKIAIVLDDWGYSLRQIPALRSIPHPLTVAVLPSLPYSTQVAREAHARGFEVMVHFPMEARDPDAPRESGTLMTGASPSEVIEQIERSLESVPFAKGLNNHQGSKATADPVLMRTVLGELKRRRLYFLDSVVTEDSVCEGLARSLRLPYARRAVFLDNDPAPEAIRRRLAELARAAAGQGHAVGIGHDRPQTLKVLAEAVPALKKAGYTLVPVSELAEAGR